MIGQRERKIVRRQQAMTAGIVVLCLVVAFFPPARDAAVNFVKPVARFLHGIGVSWRQREDDLRTLSTANAEIERLRMLSDTLIFDRTEYQRLKRENEELRKMVKYEAPEKFRTVPCEILTFDVSGERKLVTLDCGTERAIARGYAVLSPEGMLIGTVESVRAGHSVVALLKDPQSRVAADVSGIDDSQGIVMPVGGGAVALRYLGENVRVSPSSIIQTSGLLDQVPAGIPIGTTDTTAKETDTPFQRAIIQTPIDPSVLTLVNVVIAL